MTIKTRVARLEKGARITNSGTIAVNVYDGEGVEDAVDQHRRAHKLSDHDWSTLRETKLIVLIQLYCERPTAPSPPAEQAEPRVP